MLLIQHYYRGIYHSTITEHGKVYYKLTLVETMLITYPKYLYPEYAVRSRACSELCMFETYNVNISIATTINSQARIRDACTLKSSGLNCPCLPSMRPSNSKYL